MPDRPGGLTELARRLGPTPDDWSAVHRSFTTWAGTADRRDQLREHLVGLSPPQRAALAGRSRETTTHFAWCLRDRPEEDFSFWLHEYKPQRDWRLGYADSVHNHRYHFCTTILAGGYAHERYEVTLAADGERIAAARLIRRSSCPVGAAGLLLASEFHRVPRAADGTMTFLVKSRPVRDWSLSWDPDTRVTRRHLPVEARLDTLTARL